jgi:hypothetical protein
MYNFEILCQEQKPLRQPLQLTFHIITLILISLNSPRYLNFFLHESDHS